MNKLYVKFSDGIHTSEYSSANGYKWNIKSTVISIEHWKFIEDQTPPVLDKKIYIPISSCAYFNEEFNV